LRGQIKITEQGEVIGDRYFEPDMAHHHLRQITNAVLRASFTEVAKHPDPAWETALQEMADVARQRYHSLVYDHPGFLTYFRNATPIAEIGRLRIGSRPASRRKGDRIEDLRAIPWVFSWMQSRHALPGWFGLGTGLESYSVPPAETDGQPQAERLAMLRIMYREWAFFQMLIDNAQMMLAKADMHIARRYADLVPDQALADEIFGQINDEFQRTRRMICAVAEIDEILDRDKLLQESLKRRNLYIDPLNYLQVELLRRFRATKPGPASEAIEAALLLSINGIAAGLKNTG
jgi:phosphoenolpyruvate carboxylase